MADAVELRAGPVRLLFEPDSGWVRYLSVGGVEVVRAIYGAVRDRNWGTVPPAVEGLAIDAGADRFRATFRAVCRDGPVDFRWDGTVTGDPDGTVAVRFAGRAESTFLRNRIGLCVLHPVRGVRGADCVVTHPNGATTAGRFPELISPHQPFRNVRAMRYRVAGGPEVEVAFTGEVFETEDHRNWIDGSYKTYGTPLEKPFPVEVSAGATVEQTVTVRLLGPAPADPVSRGDGIVLRRTPGGWLPRLGLDVPGGGDSHSFVTAGRVRALGLGHLRVELPMDSERWWENLAAAANWARAVEVPLHAALVLSDDADAELAWLVHELDRIGPPVAAWGVFGKGAKATPADLAGRAREVLNALTPEVPVGVGARAYFTELNRNRPAGPADFACYSINPQVHAPDERSMVEGLEGIADTVRTARSFLSAGTPVHVGPVTLRPRFNPNATADDEPPGPDPRQGTPFAAAWTVGCLAELSRAGAEVATFYETAGPGGVMGTDGVFPVYRVFAALAGLGGQPVDLLDADDPLTVGGLACGRAGLVANFTGRPQVVRLPDDPRPAEVELGPYAVHVLGEGGR